MLPVEKTAVIYFALGRTRRYKVWESTEGFFSKPCSRPSQSTKSVKKPGSILKSAQESQPVIDCARLRMWIRQQQRKQWRVLQRLSGDSTEMKQRLLRLLIVSLRETGSSFISLFGFPLTSSDCLLCVFQMMSCQTAKQLVVLIMSCSSDRSHKIIKRRRNFFFCQSLTRNMPHSLLWIHLNLNIYKHFHCSATIKCPLMTSAIW